MIELTRKLTEAWGPSGYEHHVRKLIEAEVKDLADEITVDPLGNLICRVGKGGTKIMVAAHMDEIGVMTTFVEPKSGYLRFANVGGLLHTTLIANRVQFENGTTGVIGVEDMWGGARTNVPNLDDFFIDVSEGSGDGKVQPGMPGVFSQRMEQRGTRLIGKAMDDRIGCIVAIETMRRLKKKTKNEVYFVFTVQEEVGLRGARPAAYNVDPEIGIALDVTGTGDEIHGRKMDVKLGGGAAVKINDPGLVVPAAVRDWMIDRAEKDKITYQRELLAGGTTDAAGIQMARSGVPSGCISIPCRYVHTTSETVDVRDVEACIALLTGLTKNPAKL
ncbi:MAG: M20/M25/M40 family metallo-hydrolase [Anaerolineae bacterium]